MKKANDNKTTNKARKQFAIIASAEIYTAKKAQENNGKTVLEKTRAEQAEQVNKAREVLDYIEAQERNGLLNKYGIQPYKDGEIIEAHNNATNCAILRGIVTCINALVYIAKLKRDKIANNSIALYLDNEIAVLRYMRYNARIDNGVLNYSEARYFSDISEQLSEIDSAFAVLVQHNGEAMTKTIFKECSRDYGARNTYGANNPANNEASAKFTTQTQDAPMYAKSAFDSAVEYMEAVADIKNGALKRAIMEALKRETITAFDVQIVLDVANGYSQTALADTYKTTQGNIAKHYKKALEALREAMARQGITAYGETR